MIERIIQSCLRHRFLVLVALAGLVAYGVYASLKLQVDAFPDVTNVQVQVYTTWPGMSPEEVEKQVTFPIEVQMAGLPDMAELRSVSRFGFSLITVVFADQVDLYFARQLVLERLIAAKEKLPKGSDPVLGPIATGLSEIYQYTLEEENAPPPASPGEETARLIRLRTIQDAIVRPFLKTVPGVTDINSFGGYVKQYQVQVDPDRLRKFDLSLKQVFSALTAGNANAGGNILERGSEQALVRGLGLMQSIQDIEEVVLKEVNGTPVLVKDVATVSEGPASRWGAVLKNGKREAVAGIVLMIRGGSGREVVGAVKEKVAQLNAGGILPKGVTLKAFYDRTGLVRDCINTVGRAIAEGVLLVILVVYLFLRSFRGALVIALTLPLVALATFIAMRQVGLSANLMSLGGLAISIGMIVDSTIIQVENVMHRLGEMEPGREFRPHGAQRRPGGAETQPLRGVDHCLDLSPHHDPARHGGENVRSPGLHRGHRAFGLPGAFHSGDPVPVLVCAQTGARSVSASWCGRPSGFTVRCWPWPWKTARPCSWAPGAFWRCLWPPCPFWAPSLSPEWMKAISPMSRSACRRSPCPSRWRWNARCSRPS